MRRTVAGIDRFIAVVVGVGLIAGGVLVLCWRAGVDAVRTLFGYADQGWYAQAPHQPWWPWALGAAVVVLLVAGLWLLSANVRPHRLAAVELPGSGDFGTLSVHMTQVGNAAATMLARHPGIRHAGAIAVIHRRRPTIRLTLTARPEVPLTELRRLAAHTEADIQAALEHAVDAQFFVRYLPADAGF